eukprot:SAG11_NODE_33948_length_274_cov_1.177143_1_plen_59_part_10
MGTDAAGNKYFEEEAVPGSRPRRTVEAREDVGQYGMSSQNNESFDTERDMPPGAAETAR